VYSTHAQARAPDIQRPELIAIDLPVFAFASAACILTTLLFGLAPAIAASRWDLNSALKAGGAWEHLRRTSAPGSS
jgi:hypothetical protein